jgi:hypothetical protein
MMTAATSLLTAYLHADLRGVTPWIVISANADTSALCKAGVRPSVGRPFDVKASAGQAVFG